MTSIGSAKADQLEALVYTIENATALQTKLVIRNSEAWIASAIRQIVATPTIDEAAKKALTDALKFGAHLPSAASKPEEFRAGESDGFAARENIEGLRVAALASVRAFQTSLLDAAPVGAGSTLHC